MNKELIKQYKELTPEERKQEIRLLEEELEPLLGCINRLKECLKYLKWNVVAKS